MKKLIATAFLVVFGAFALTSAKAELSLWISGFYAVSVDQTTSAGLDTAAQTPVSRSGLSNGKFTRLIATVLL